MGYEPDLTLAAARAIIDRALDKARELKQAGAFALVDVGGNVISLSRMGNAPMIAARIARAKAYVSAVQRAPSARSAKNWRESPVLFSSFQRINRDEIFPGPGAMPIRKGERVVGALAASGIGPWTEILGVDPSLLMADGVPANAEDLIIAHALGIPYENQHSDSGPAVGLRVEEQVDDLPHSLGTARRYADTVIACGRERGQDHIAVAVVDEVGQLMQVDRLDGGTLMSPDVAEAKALTALNFLQPSSELDLDRITPAIQTGLRSFVRFNMHFIGGGVTIVRDGWVVGAIGISHGGGTHQEDELGRYAIARVDASPGLTG